MGMSSYQFFKVSFILPFLPDALVDDPVKRRGSRIPLLFNNIAKLGLQAFLILGERRLYGFAIG